MCVARSHVAPTSSPASASWSGKEQGEADVAAHVSYARLSLFGGARGRAPDPRHPVRLQGSFRECLRRISSALDGLGGSRIGLYWLGLECGPPIGLAGKLQDSASLPCAHLTVTPPDSHSAACQPRRRAPAVPQPAAAAVVLRCGACVLGTGAPGKRAKGMRTA